MEQLYCVIKGGRPTNMRLKALLRLLNLVLLLGVHNFFGMDITVIVIAVLAVADLDAIAEHFDRKDKEHGK